MVQYGDGKGESCRSNSSGQHTQSACTRTPRRPHPTQRPKQKWHPLRVVQVRVHGGEDGGQAPKVTQGVLVDALPGHVSNGAQGGALDLLRVGRGRWGIVTALRGNARRTGG